MLTSSNRTEGRLRGKSIFYNVCTLLRMSVIHVRLLIRARTAPLNSIAHGAFGVLNLCSVQHVMAISTWKPLQKRLPREELSMQEYHSSRTVRCSQRAVEYISVITFRRYPSLQYIFNVCMPVLRSIRRLLFLRRRGRDEAVGRGEDIPKCRDLTSSKK